MVVMAYEWHSGFFVFEICFCSRYRVRDSFREKKHRASKRRESRAERERVICGNSKFNGV
jgi:hypothetical protein